MELPKIYSMSFARVYPLYIAKVERQQRTKAELDELIFWLTGHSAVSLQKALDEEHDFTRFFNDAPKLNPARMQITGVICGVRVEEIKEPLMQEIRRLDKIVDELAKGKDLNKIMRSSE